VNKAVGRHIRYTIKMYMKILLVKTPQTIITRVLTKTKKSKEGTKNEHLLKLLKTIITNKLLLCLLKIHQFNQLRSQINFMATKEILII